MGTFTKLALGLIGQLKPEPIDDHAVAGSVSLPPPQPDGGIPLMKAIARRASWREFSPQELPLQTLSNLLWAAYGINRPERKGRTAPSALGAQEVTVFVALREGTYVYRPAEHALELVAATDARKVTGYQDFVDKAPLDLIYVADHARAEPISDVERAIFSAVTAGAITQNVSLFCASAGLATVVRGWFDRHALAAALGIGKDERVLITQTVGFPALR